jgi:hypothetical protein
MDRKEWVELGKAIEAKEKAEAYEQAGEKSFVVTCRTSNGEEGRRLRSGLSSSFKVVEGDPLWQTLVDFMDGKVSEDKLAAVAKETSMVAAKD